MGEGTGTLDVAALRSIVENVPSAVVVLDRERRYLIVNRAWIDAYRLPIADPAALVGRAHYDLFPDLPPAWREVHRRCLAGASERGEGRFLRASGDQHWVRWSVMPWRDAAGAIGGIAIFSEIRTEQREAEADRARLRDALGIERARLETVLRHVPAGVLIADAPSGEIVFGNEQVAVLLRHPILWSKSAEAYGEWVGWHPDGRRVASHEWPLARALAGESCSGDFIYRRGDETSIWIRVSGAPIRNAEGSIVGAICVFHDIDEAKRTEEALLRMNERLEERVARRTRELAQSEQRYAAIFEHSPLHLYLLDCREDGSFVYEEASPSLYRDTGLTPATALGRTPQELFGADGELLALRYRECATSQQRVEYEASLAMPVGRLIRRNILVPVIGEDGRTRKILGTARDVTEAKRMEEALRLSEQNYRDLYNRTPIALHSVDAEARLISVNDSWCRLFGYTREEVLGRTPAEFMTPESARHYREVAWPGFLTQRKISTNEYQFIRRSGEIIEVRTAAVADRDATGRAIRSWTVLTDITGEKQTEEALRQAQKMEAVGQLTGGVAHDFNNLLTAVIGNLDLARMRNEAPGVARLLDGAARAAERGARLTEQLLAFSRRQRLAPRSVDLNETVAGMEGLLRSTIGGTIEIETQLGEGLWPALVDVNQIELVLLNLVINARDAMPEGGKVVIATRNVTAGEPAGHFQGGEFIAISVSDTGIGMAPDVLARAFEPFFTTKQPGRGSGLGLSMVYGVIRQLGGDVTMTSRPGAGTRVELFVPRAATPPQKESGPVRRPATSAARRGCVLLVDDDEDVRETTAALLADLGYDVVEAASGPAALALAADGRREIDLALVDFAMPGMNGTETLEALDKCRPGIPRVLATGHADAPPPSGAATLLIRKPFRRHELETVLGHALARAQHSENGAAPAPEENPE